MSFAIILWLHVGRLHKEYVEFRCYAATIVYIINHTFKDNLQKINNIIQLENFFKKTLAVLHTTLCAIFQ